MPLSVEHQRRRGRPRLTEQDLKINQQLVLDTMCQLLGRYPLSQLSIELIIQEANISRPSFYRWFPDGFDQALEAIMQQVNHQIPQVVLSALAQQPCQDIESKMCCAVQAGFAWAKQHNHVVNALHQISFDSSTRAYHYRQNSVEALTMIAMNELRAAQVDCLSVLTVHTMILWMEMAMIEAVNQYAQGVDVFEAQQNLTIDTMRFHLRRAQSHRQASA